MNCFFHFYCLTWKEGYRNELDTADGAERLNQKETNGWPAGKLESSSAGQERGKAVVRETRRRKPSEWIADRTGVTYYQEALINGVKKGREGSCQEGRLCGRVL